MSTDPGRLRPPLPASPRSARGFTLLGGSSANGGSRGGGAFVNGNPGNVGGNGGNGGIGGNGVITLRGAGALSSVSSPAATLRTP